MSLWCLMASPLFYSGDMSKLDDFTLNVLCNPEVIAIDQDPLGQCAKVVPYAGEAFLMIKDLEDGSKAVGLCNKGELPAKVAVKWADIGVAGTPQVRDVWRQKDLGTFRGGFSSERRPPGRSPAANFPGQTLAENSRGPIGSGRRSTSAAGSRVPHRFDIGKGSRSNEKQP